MNQTLKRALALLMIFCLMIGFVPMEGMRDLIPQASAESGQDAVRNAEIPKAFSLPDSPLGAEHTSGPWRYALRVSDSYAVITGYDGTETELVVPQELDGIDIVGLASKALPQAEHVTLHTNIFYLTEDCFGKDLREITAPNGSLGLYWASSHDCAYSTGKDYDLVPGVIDYTDALPGRVQKRGDSHVVFSTLEAMPLKVGSIFFMRDTREMEFFLRVLELTENGSGVIATVEIPDVADAIINYETTVAVALTADDFIPADGVTVETAPASTKTVSTKRESKETTLEIGPFGVLKESGRNDSTKVNVDISGKVVSKNTVIYTVNIQNGVLTATEYTEEQTLETSVSITAKGEENLLKEYGEAQETLKKASEGKPVSKEEKSKLKALLGISLEDVNDITGGINASDIAKASEQISKWWESIISGKPVGGTWECGEYKLQTPYFNVSVSVSINVSVSGSITYSNSHTNVTKNVYNFDTDEWETVYSNGNAATGKNGQSIVAQIKGTVGLEIEIAVGAFFIKNFSAKLELGVEFSASKKFGDGTTLAFLNCSIFTIKPYMKIQIYIGVWVGKSTGLKQEIYNKEWTLQELTGSEYLWQSHINIALGEKTIHSADECPLDSAKKVSYDTKTGLQVQTKTLFVGKPLTSEFNVDLNNREEVKAADWRAGAFLGWAWEETDTEPTAAAPGEAFKNPDGTTGDVFLTQNVTLYAVWSQTFTVHFDTNGGTEVPDQSVPSGGYITKPQNPTKELGIFVGWRDGNGEYWDFERDTVNSDMTLTADWGTGDAPTPGMLNAAYIGEYDDVSADCKYNPNSLISRGIIIPAWFLEYEVMRNPDGSPIGLKITGVKNSPERLIIPKTLPYGNDEEGLEVVEITQDAFRNCTSLRSVYFLTDDDKRFTTDKMFSGCANLEYVELPALENGLIGNGIFSGCTSLKCVKVRAGANAIGDNAFESTALRTCIIGMGITSIGYYAFQNCNKMENLYIPDSVKTISNNASIGTVISFDQGPFYGCTALKQISVGGVTTLEIGMLRTGRNTALEKLTIRGTVGSIGDYAFYSSYGNSLFDCDGCAELEIENGVKSIGKKAFYNCDIFSTITIPESITNIESCAFESCDNLKSVKLKQVKLIKDRTFAYCYSLEELDLGVAESLGEDCFMHCTALRTLYLGSVKTINKSAFSGCTSLETLDLCTVENIHEYAFSGCSALEELYIPDTVKMISVDNKAHSHPYDSPWKNRYYNGPFVGCTGLKRISIGGVETIEPGMLKTGSQVLERLTIRGSVSEIDQDAFNSRNGYSTGSGVPSDSGFGGYTYNGYAYEGDAELIIEEGVKTIDWDAFESCKIFSTISIPESVSYVGECAFQDCVNLNSVTLKQVKSIDRYAFSGCKGLKELDLGAVENIDDFAFEFCSALEELYIPDTVKVMSKRGPFAGCTGLKRISVGGVETLSGNMLLTDSQVLEKLTIRGTVSNIGRNAFDSYMNCDFYHYLNGRDEYELHVWANGYDNPGNAELVIEEGVKTIGDYAFRNCDIFSSITIPESVTSIGEFAFASCDGIYEITLPNALDILKSNAFENCVNLNKVTLKHVKTIGSYAFAGCTCLKELDMGSSESIAAYAFSNCRSLEELYIPDTVKTIGVDSSDFYLGSTYSDGYHRSYYCYANNGPFIGCTGLKRISVGGVKTLTDGMLKTGSDVLEKLTIRGTVTIIGTSAFDSYNGYSTSTSSPDNAYANGYAFDGHAELEIEEGVKTIGDYAFLNCKIFSTITVPESITSVGSYAFANCVNLTDMLFRGTNMPFADTAFSGDVNPTVHLADENESMAQFTASKGIRYDTAAAFPHVLTLEMNRGSENDRSERTVEWLAELELPAPVWDGHVFSGWYLDTPCTSRWTGPKMPNRDLMLYAGWDIDVYTLTLNLTGGAAEKTQYRIHAGDEIHVNVPTRDGYFFLGWSPVENSRSFFSGVMPAEDTTLYACWQAESANGRYRNDGDHATLIGYERIEEESRTVYLPETVDGLPLTTIAAGAFAYSGVKTLYIPDSVTEIEPGAFSNGQSLVEINIAESNIVYSSWGGSVYSKDGTAILFFPPAGYSTYLHNGVTKIGERAFDGSKLERIELPESITEIGPRAFRNTAITALTLPASVETIDERAFTGCRDLALVEALGSPETVESGAFSGCSGFLLAYGPNENCAFRREMRANGYLYNAYTLTMVQPTRTTTAFLQAGADLMLPEAPEMPENEQFTGWYLDDAFTESLTETTMPAYELTIYAGTVQVFDYTTVTDEETQASSLTLTACHALGDSVEIPESIDGVPVTKLAAGTFGKQYRQVIIPASVTEIESGTFAKGTTLVCVPGSAAEAWAQANGFKTGVMTWTLRYETGFKLTPDPTELPGGNTLPLPIMTRTGYTFSGWYWDAEGTEAVEQSAVMPQQDTTLYAGWTVSDDAAAQMADALQWTLDPATDTISITAYTGMATALDIPEKLHGKTVTAIEDYAFAYNPTLTEVKLPSTVTVIGTRAFFAMHALTEVILPAALKAIPDEAFTDCIALANISLPAGLEAIGANAFKNTGLTALTLPTSLKSIHATALTDCAALTEITVTTGNRYYESRDGVLFDTADGVLVKYPAARPNSSYAVENTWSVGAWAFDGAQNLTEITLSADIWSVGEGAFAGCSNLTAMPELNGMITIIPDRCFYGCAGLRDAGIHAAVKKIGTLAFAGTALSDVTIPGSVVQIGLDAFNRDVILRGERESYAEIWAKDNGSTFIPTGAVTIERIAVKQEELTLKRGERAKLELTIEPSGADPSYVDFTSSAAGIVNVDADGAIHAIAGGSAVIYATAPGGISASCRVTVEVDVEAISLDAESIRLAVGSTQQLRESFTPLRVTDRGIVWTSSNEEVVIVNDNGLVTAIADGESVIRATAHNGLFAECTVRAFISVESISFEQTEIVGYVGDTFNLVLTVEPENATWRTATWNSSDESVATVDAYGLVSLLNPGNVIITAETEGKYAYCSITICNHINSFILNNPVIIHGKKSETVQLNPVFDPNNVINTTVHYTSSNEFAATVDDSGLVTFQDAGFATIITATPEVDETMAQSVIALCGNVLQLPDAVTTIEDEAFVGITAQYIIVPDHVLRVGSKAFAFTNNSDVIFLNGDVQIADDAFDGCEMLIIIAPQNSRVEDYAIAHGFPSIDWLSLLNDT